MTAVPTIWSSALCTALLARSCCSSGFILPPCVQATGHLHDEVTGQNERAAVSQRYEQDKRRKVHGLGGSLHKLTPRARGCPFPRTAGRLRHRIPLAGHPAGQRSLRHLPRLTTELKVHAEM